jgi:16S rRNA (cytidine1402-2'-O)-methyltransferase
MGKLIVVPTPIGNLEDMTFRAVRILREVDSILAEDTRQTKKLLDHYQIQKPLYPYHKFNEQKSVEKIMDKLMTGSNIALVSDCGTPGISDPGHIIVKACIDAGIEIETLPGATAFVPALINSGFSTDEFLFIGFLPHKKGRQTQLKKIALEPRTVILYESPFRVVKLLEEINLFIGKDRKISASRELSKFFEETVRGTADELLAHFKTKEPKGEFVVVIEGAILQKKSKRESED